MNSSRRSQKSRLTLRRHRTKLSWQQCLPGLLLCPSQRVCIWANCRLHSLGRFRWVVGEQTLCTSTSSRMLLDSCEASFLVMCTIAVDCIHSFTNTDPGSGLQPSCLRGSRAGTISEVRRPTFSTSQAMKRRMMFCSPCRWRSLETRCMRFFFAACHECSFCAV